ncbi:3'(2'),5'-bisphosphate nucleotidase CysQ [Bizionia gelidisalsuginis]|uniref:3'(2'),5'-bisphosphate nucleotidase CysQ n=1 Tax=Bizionia gelidisalsuginis TaxID=291188 RepID=A0ABY3MCP4_9FLAO|nr:3'(2'),5'-bisphosphate nucleotidase CysQ [Bizionia gelidisalsuginis]TYC15650.1 3'(2'),5'-bisphosphate nucleotidase CysQ [Bizionia gelidisalsuginis]
MNYTEHLELILKATREAGEAILDVYYSNDFNIAIKGDESPITRADNIAHNIIESYLKQTPYPILSEEGAKIPFNNRKDWNLFWMVDPLDGTKEFIKQNGEFTVNIALIENGNPIFGVVFAPVLDKLYYGGEGYGAHLISENGTSKLTNSKNKIGKTRIVASRSHLNVDTENFINTFNEVEIISMGSSLKFMMLAEGRADIYPRFAPTMEWDTAAAHAILKALGKDVFEPTTKFPLRYNKENLLNPFFIAK